MKKVRYLFIHFKEGIHEWELPFFRAGIIEKAGREHILFHHHVGDGYLYKYPLIQYKTVGKKPALLCLEKGVDEVYHFFKNSSWDILLGERPYKAEVENLKLNSFVLQVWNALIPYRLMKWLPLNEKNYAAYKALQSPEEKNAFLEKILCANVLSFAKGMGWTVDKQIKCRILNITNERWIRFKDLKLWGMDAEFEMNVSLPSYIGLGKGASKGYGIVRRINRKREEENAEEANTIATS